MEAKQKQYVPSTFLPDFKCQAAARSFLWKSTAGNRIGSSYIFYGAEGVGKFVAALEWIKFLKCENKNELRPCGKCSACRTIDLWDNPDILIIFPMPKELWETQGAPLTEILEIFRVKPHVIPTFEKNAFIVIDQIREIQRFLATPSTYPSGKFVIVANAHQMNLPAANAFLKTLEEPPENAHIILTTSKFEYLLQTIRSRCQCVRFVPLPQDVLKNLLTTRYDISDHAANEAVMLSEGNILRALTISSENFKHTRTDAQKVLHYATTNDAISLFDWADSCTGKADYATGFCVASLSFIRDITATFCHAPVINTDCESTILAAARALGSAELAQELFDRVHDFEKKLDRNPQLSLFYSALATGFFEIFSRASTSAPKNKT